MGSGRQSVSFLGLGYVGLCTAAVFAARGFQVMGIDIDEERVARIRSGRAPFHEPGLDEVLKKGLKSGRLKVTSDISNSVRANITFITVGTPSKPNGFIDLTYVTDAVRQLGATLRGKSSYHVVVVKSTIIPGTTLSVRSLLESESERTVGGGIGLCVNPEFLKEGSAIADTLHPDKIVIGAFDQKSVTRLKRLYKQFYRGKPPPTITTAPQTAEMIKYASNAFLATKISFINSMADICQKSPGVDVEKVAEVIGLDPRIGPHFLKSGPGYGGSCFHKDLQALIAYSRSMDYDPVLLVATETVNVKQASRVVDLSEKLLGSLKEKRVAVLGLAFKKDTDDVREAASIRVINQLLDRGAMVVAYDPMAIPGAKELLQGSIEYGRDAKSTIKGADCCIIMTEWDEFRKLKVNDYLAFMKAPNLVDARRLYNPEDYQELNFAAIGLGPAKT